MLADNYLNLPMSHIDRPVYRIISVKRLLELFQRRQNVLVKPKLWDDPFENFILNSYMLLQGKKSTLLSRDYVYGQCWTRHAESDAMWRIYSPEKDGVRVRSTPRRLAEGLAASSCGRADMEAFIGAVRYLSQNALYDFARTLSIRDSWEAESLLAKRLAFAHEREVRLIYVAQPDMSSNLHPYQVDPHAMIDQIMIDPRQSAEDAERTGTRIREETLFRGDIVRSSLYAPPRRLMLVFNLSASPRRRREKHIPEHDETPLLDFGELTAMVPVGRKSKGKALPLPFTPLTLALRRKAKKTRARNT
jgi:hypothetical protein